MVATWSEHAGEELRRAGFRSGGARRAVVDFLGGRDCCVSAQELHDGLRTVAAAWDGPDRDRVLAQTWPSLEKIAIDHAVAEPVAAVGGVAVVPGTFGWDDVGDFNSLAALLPSVDGAGSKVLGDAGRVVRRDSAGSVVVPAGDRVVTVLGLDDVVVVDTPDALLVTTRARAQQVKSMVDTVRELGLDELL